MRMMAVIASFTVAVGLVLANDHASLGNRAAPRYITFSTTGPAPAGVADAPEVAQCVNKTVQCNYAQWYTGKISWSHTIIAPNAQHYDNATVSVTNGVASCNGGVREVDHGQTTSGSINGPGLIGIQFMLDSANKLVYRIIGACPTAAGMGSPVQPADLDHNSMETYEQRATKIEQQLLADSVSYPAPEVDPVNNVTGTVVVVWSFKHR